MGGGWWSWWGAGGEGGETSSGVGSHPWWQRAWRGPSMLAVWWDPWLNWQNPLQGGTYFFREIRRRHWYVLIHMTQRLNPVKMLQLAVDGVVLRDIAVDPLRVTLWISWSMNCLVQQNALSIVGQLGRWRPRTAWRERSCLPESHPILLSPVNAPTGGCNGRGLEEKQTGVFPCAGDKARLPR